MKIGKAWIGLVSRWRERIRSWVDQRICTRAADELFEQRESAYVQARLVGNVARVNSLNDEMALATQQALAARKYASCRLRTAAKRLIAILPATPSPGEPEAAERGRDGRLRPKPAAAGPSAG